MSNYVYTLEEGYDEFDELVRAADTLEGVAHNLSQLLRAGRPLYVTAWETGARVATVRFLRGLRPLISSQPLDRSVADAIVELDQAETTGA